jgi:hypothetical protein
MIKYLQQEVLYTLQTLLVLTKDFVLCTSRIESDSYSVVNSCYINKALRLQHKGSIA